MDRRNIFLTSDSTSHPSGIDIRTILSTELRLLEPICTFTDHDGYSIYRSDTYPDDYCANGVRIHDPRNRSLEEWEDIFHHHFAEYVFEHTTFTFPYKEDYTHLMEEARDAGYHVYVLAYMFVDNTRACRELPNGMYIRKIESINDWRRLRELNDHVSEEEDWYNRDMVMNMSFTREMSEQIGIEWYYITAANGNEIMASLGIFEHNGICRLQDVQTSPTHRGRGLASALVSHAIRQAIETRGTKGLAICADVDYYAIDLYRKLGFVECGREVLIMRYPMRNPIYLQGAIHFNGCTYLVENGQIQNYEFKK